MTETKFETQQVQIVRPEGLVAQIISARELAINIGSSQGVKKGMIFKVLADKPVEIRDPETGDVLDSIDREKVRVMVTEVRERIAICATYRSKKTRAGHLYSSMMGAASLNAFNAPSETFETLRSKDSSLPAPLQPEESYVKIGDRVVEITEED